MSTRHFALCDRLVLSSSAVQAICRISRVSGSRVSAGPPRALKQRRFPGADPCGYLPDRLVLSSSAGSRAPGDDPCGYLPDRLVLSSSSLPSERSSSSMTTEEGGGEGDDHAPVD